MTTCPSCGGILGRDCFNPSDCAMITEAMQQEIDDQDHSGAIAQLRQRIREVESERNHWRDKAMDLSESFALGPQVNEIKQLTTELTAAKAENERLKRGIEADWIAARDMTNAHLESGSWFLWDDGNLPLPVHLAYSPTTDEVFATLGQLGWNRAQDVKDMGGWFRLIAADECPHMERIDD